LYPPKFIFVLSERKTQTNVPQRIGEFFGIDHSDSVVPEKNDNLGLIAKCGFLSWAGKSGSKRKPASLREAST